MFPCQDSLDCLGKLFSWKFFQSPSYVMANFVMTVAGAILAIGIEALDWGLFVRCFGNDNLLEYLVLIFTAGMVVVSILIKSLSSSHCT